MGGVENVLNMSSKTGFDKFLENQMNDATFAADFAKARNEIDTIDKLRNQIPGLIYVPDWIDSELEDSLLKKIQEGIWESSLQRRVQQFGPQYNYSTRQLNTSSYQKIPPWIEELYPELSKWFQTNPSQIIINEYEPGQGITKHTDAKIFGPTIASLSLLSDTHLTLGQYRGSETKVLLKRNSLIVMSDEARSKWYHYIAPVKEKRISITFRTIL